MLAQINSIRGVCWLLALALVLSGCTPAGPRALLKGKRCLDRGDLAEAVTQFRRATALLPANAAAWNYLGVACQRSGQAEEAANAYDTALRLDRGLAEAHFNLAVLRLEQNRPDLAKAELTAYTLQRPNDPRGWLNLGYALLKTGDLALAERSFSTVLSLKTDAAEAYNGLGLARLQEGKFRDAAQFFAAAVQMRPAFAAPLQNLGTVQLQYLHDEKAALATFQAYLNLAPRAANYNEVMELVASLIQSEGVAVPPATTIRTSQPAAEPRARLATVNAPRPAPTERSEEETKAYRPSPRPAVVVPAPEQPSPQTVSLRPEPTLVTSPKTSHVGRPAVADSSNPKAEATNELAAAVPLEAPMPEDETHRYGFWHRLFEGDKPSTNSARRFHEDTSVPVSPPDSASGIGITPLPSPAAAEAIAGTKPEAEPKPEPVTTGPRYAYAFPPQPAAGDRRSAQSEFTKARRAEEDENWGEAERWYQTAADADPSWFEAQYNTGVMAYRLRNYSVALPRYELALAIQPDSLEARYNFALALKAAGYALDAVEQLNKILAVKPNDVRVHLALGNLYAHSLHDLPRARHHYLRVLDLQPNIRQAEDIRFWLSENPASAKSE